MGKVVVPAVMVIIAIQLRRLVRFFIVKQVVPIVLVILIIVRGKRPEEFLLFPILTVKQVVILVEESDLGIVKIRSKLFTILPNIHTFFLNIYNIYFDVK